MEELIITNKMRERINDYLGYEFIRKNEVGHHMYDEAPGLGKIGIECNELKHVVTNKQLDSNGNVEWYKNPHPTKARPGEIKPFHCKLTTVSAKKAKILIASLFPEEAVDKNFLGENREAIEELRKQLHIVREKSKVAQKISAIKESFRPHRMVMGPNDMFLDGALFYLYGEIREFERPIMLFGPNDMPL